MIFGYLCCMVDRMIDGYAPCVIFHLPGSHVTDNDSDGSVNGGSPKPPPNQQHRKEKKEFPVSLKISRTHMHILLHNMGFSQDHHASHFYFHWVSRMQKSSICFMHTESPTMRLLFHTNLKYDASLCQIHTLIITEGETGIASCLIDFDRTHRQSILFCCYLGVSLLRLKVKQAAIFKAIVVVCLCCASSLSYVFFASSSPLLETSYQRPATHSQSAGE